MLFSVIAVCILGFVGWSIYNPVMEYLSQGRPELPSSSSVPPASSGTLSEQPQEQETQPPAEPVPDEPLRAIYIPPDMAADSERLQNTLSAFSGSGINAVMIDLKDTSGNLLYRSQLETAEQARNYKEGSTFDLKSFCSRLAAQKLSVIGRVNAFLDPMSSRYLPGAGIEYLNSGVLWLDNSPEAGGQPWLNPYSEAAQSYLTDIVAEAASMGVSHILLDNVTFPVGYGLEYAGYGADAATVTQSEILARFVDQAEQAAADEGASLSLYVSGIGALGGLDQYFGGSPFDVANQNIVLGVMPAQFGDGYAIGSFSVQQPVLDPSGTVGALLQAVTGSLSGKDVTGLVQAYSAPYTIENSYTYTIQDINAQIEALRENGIEQYILYHPNGNYPH